MFKRKFSGRNRRFRKRPRLSFRGRRRLWRRGRRSAFQGRASTTRWGRPHATNYRSRKIGTRRWRSVLWRDTLASQHYRTTNSGNQPLSGTAIGAPNAAGAWLFPALQVVNGTFQPYHGAGSSFWESGVETPDIGALIPNFRGDITLRGGIARLMIGAYPENVILRIKVYAIWAKKNPDVDVYTFINNSNRQVEWDFSMFPEFSTKFGKILYMKEAMVPVGEAFEITHRFKPQKIDQAVFRGEPPAVGAQPAECAGDQLWWGVIAVPLDSNALSANITCVNSWSLSFSADAIGTT